MFSTFETLLMHDKVESTPNSESHVYFYLLHNSVFVHDINIFTWSRSQGPGLSCPRAA